MEVRLLIQRFSFEQIPVFERIHPRELLVSLPRLRTSFLFGMHTQAHQFCFSFPVRQYLARLIQGILLFLQANAFFQGPTYAYLLLS